MDDKKLMNTVHPQLKLDCGFVPMALYNRNYRQLTAAADCCRFAAAICRNDGAVARIDLRLLPPGSEHDRETIFYTVRQLKNLIWGHGGSKLYISGPDKLCRQLKKIYSPDGERGYDLQRMTTVYGSEFQLFQVDACDMPSAVTAEKTLGGFTDGCRIGFDLGASDYKLAAVIDGKAVFTTEIPWNPSVQTDPEYHCCHIRDGLKLAAEHLPRVDAIGGSAAGAYVDNQVRYASLFRAVPADKFKSQVEPLFLNLQRAWQVPLEVMNDGEVTALAGAMSLKKTALLGIAMGSSEATGFINAAGRFTGNYNELAYIPVDANSKAVIDAVSGDCGCGAQYFSQQAVARLAAAAGIELPDDMPLPERLKQVQALADNDFPAAVEVFTTIGVYLGYTLPFYRQLYAFNNVLILGRVTSGRGGKIIFDTAREVLERNFPETAAEIELHVPDEKSRRVGQAVAAATLPQLPNSIG